MFRGCMPCNGLALRILSHVRSKCCTVYESVSLRVTPTRSKSCQAVDLGILKHVAECCRHNTQLIKGIPEMFSKHQTENDIAVRKSRAKEGELRDWFDSTIAEMEDTAARRVHYAEACTEQARVEATTEVQTLQKQLKSAIEKCKTVVRPL